MRRERDRSVRVLCSAPPFLSACKRVQWVPGARARQKPGRLLPYKAERDLRTARAQQKVSGRFRSETATHGRYASTAVSLRYSALEVSWVAWRHSYGGELGFHVTSAGERAHLMGAW